MYTVLDAWHSAGAPTLRRRRCANAPADKILSKMGEGTFGRVLECWDRKNKDYCAIKVVRNVKKYRDAAMIEVSAPHACARTSFEASVMIRRVGH